MRTNRCRASAVHVGICGVHRRWCEGASLLEVLVALSLLAVSLVGLAATQLAAQRDADAQARHERAAWMTVSIAEAMRVPSRPSAVLARARALASAALPGAGVSIVDDTMGLRAVVVHWERGAAGAFAQGRLSDADPCIRTQAHTPANCVALPFARDE